MTGLSVHILRSDLGDTTNEGITSPERIRGKHLVVFDEAIRRGNYTLQEVLDNPKFVVLRLVRRHRGEGRVWIHAEPWESPPQGHVGWMAGGNYVTTSDSRFRDVCEYPIPVHDRSETFADYDALTR